MLLQPLVLGAVTGFASSAHCAAMCGPLAASACERSAARGGLARYQAGRTAGYALAGAIAGGVGQVVALSSVSPLLVYAVPLATALALLLLARRVLGERRPLVKLGAQRKPAASWFAVLLRHAPRDPGALGALTALLPCAALGAALLLAASTESRAGGAALMAGFACASALGVLGAGLLLGRLARAGSRLAPRALALVLTCAALYVGLSPFYRGLHTRDPHATAAPSCH